MPFYNNSRIGGAMDGTHIYLNTNISNDWSSVQIENPPPAIPYVANTIYDINDIVSSRGSSYRCIADKKIDGDTVPQNAPPDATYWVLLSTTTTYIDTSTKEQNLEFNQTRAQPYLATPSDYYMSVQRFTIESPNLPVFLAQPIVGKSKNTDDSYDTIYSVTAIPVATGIPNRIYIKWIPQDKSIPLITTPITADDYKNPLFYCYSYSYFIQMVNTALASSIGGANHPLMQYNAISGLFSIQGWVDKWRTKSNGDVLGITAPVKLYFNTELYNLFSSLSSIYVAGSGSLPKGCDYQILFTTGSDVASASTQPYITNIVPDTYHNSTNHNDVINIQEYTTLPLWSPVKSIVFTASLLNVVAEMVATPVIYENGNQNVNAGKQNTDILPILIEQSIPQITGTEYKPFIFYEPQGEYRLADLYSEVPIAGLQYKVYWKDTFGNLIPFKLAVGASATLKILFRRKLFNSDQV
jgi:hypothetical protein